MILKLLYQQSNKSRDEAEVFSELAQLIVRENNLPVGVNDVNQAERLYIDLLGFLENII